MATITKTFPIEPPGTVPAWLRYIWSINEADEQAGRPETFGEPTHLEDRPAGGWIEEYATGARVVGRKDRGKVIISHPDRTK